jgi:hypothetical protein
VTTGLDPQESWCPRAPASQADLSAPLQALTGKPGSPTKRAGGGLAPPAKGFTMSKAPEASLLATVVVPVVEEAPPPPPEWKNIKIFKIIPKTQDLRPKWRVEYEDEKVPYKVSIPSWLRLLLTRNVTVLVTTDHHHSRQSKMEQ